MIPLLLTILCSSGVALILKQNDVRQGHPLVLLAGNYGMAAVISMLLLAFSPEKAFSLKTLAFGVLLASLFVYAFFAFAKAVSIAGTALASVSSRLSVVIPIVAAAILFYFAWRLLKR